MGIDEVVVCCINDGAVMKAWATDQGVGHDGEGTIINFLADPHGVLCDGMGLRMAHAGPGEIFGQGRSKRYSAYFVDNVLKVLNVAEDPEDDPAGDDFPENSLVDKMMADIKAL
jgi:peroxiredoxin